MVSGVNSVLFVAYDFPPCRNIGGSIRSEKFAKFLPDFGWRPIVVSIKVSGFVNRAESLTPVFRYKSLTPFSWPYQVYSYGWALRLLMKIPALIKKNKVNAIYVSCPPFPGAIAGAILGKSYNLPVFIDLRDAWSLDPYQEGSKLKKLVYKRIFPAIEAAVFLATSRIIVNTPSMLREYRMLYPEQFSKFYLLPNGYDSDDFSHLKDATGGVKQNSNVVKIIYTGRFGIGGRNPVEFLKAIREAIDNGLAINVLILGDQPEYIYDHIRVNHLEKYVSIKQQVPHREALNTINSSDAVLLYQEDSKYQVQAIAGKTFEYIASRKPILCICPPGDNQDVIKSYSANAIVSKGMEASDILISLKALYGVLISGYDPDKAILNEMEYQQLYERKNQAKTLARFFDKELD